MELNKVLTATEQAHDSSTYKYLEEMKEYINKFKAKELG